MFTGIVEETGELRGIQRGSKSCVLKIGCSLVLEDSRVGDSIAVNGVCLTVTSMGPDFFTADVMPETLDRSSLGKLKNKDAVNLERAMPANGRFGGHIVSGHIDGTGTIMSLQKDDNAVWYTLHAEPHVLRYVVEKGSVTVDGISLTVAYVDKQVLKVSVIPHTQQVTSLRLKNVGDIVNMECDILGKYVEKLLTPEEEKPKSGGLTEDFLREHGF